MRPARDNVDDIRVILTKARDGAIDLVESVIRLGQIELRRDIKDVSRMASEGVLFAALLLAGYCFFVVGTFWALSAWLPGWACLIGLGALHVVVGVWGLRRLRDKATNFHPMQLTSDELTKSLASLKTSFPGMSSSALPTVRDGQDADHNPRGPK